ncbi:MAG TPA: uroporphyrinogen-III C-methyltransferase [Gemmatimonadaceae bacterium]|nr:uroporphyrinogen-III C-methyltransferase [Gemmatimonadaceae bacterium]
MTPGDSSADGVVYLVGAGPGDPGLLTLRGGELLVTADAIVYDALANPDLLALASVRERDEPVELHAVGKRGGAPESAKQHEINELLIRLAREGKRVVRLKGGDPFVFGRGSEEAQALAAAGIRFEVVPGVTAGIAAPAYAGIPVTHRRAATSVTFVTGHEDPTDENGGSVDWSALARAGGTIVLYMGVTKLPRIVSALVAGGMAADTPAAAVQWGTYPRQRTVTATLGTLVTQIERAGMRPPIITVIGPVVSLRDEIAWFERRALFGKRIIVTRAQSQAATISERLAAAGAEVLEMPASRIEPLDPAPLQRAIEELARYRFVIFTSQNAVRIFWDELRAGARDARAFAGVEIAAIGPATAAALLERGLSVDVAPERFVAEALLDALRDRRDLRGARVLYAAAAGARETLEVGLRELGGVVDRVELYRSVPDGAGGAALRERLLRDEADLATFTSASSVTNFVAAVGADAAGRVPAASIGPVTSQAARDAGLRVDVEATQSTIAGLVDAIVAHYAATPVNA